MSKFTKEYDKLPDTEKVIRLEFWAKRYLDYLGVEDQEKALKEDCTKYYSEALESEND